MTEMSFEVRSTEIDKDTVYRLDQEGFGWSNSRGEGHFAYADIAAIHLMVHDSQYGRGRICTVKSRTGKKKQFRSLHCFGIGNFEDRASLYAPFVRELLRRVADSVPDAKFTRGSNFDFVLLIIGMIILGGAGAIMLIAIFGAGIEPDLELLGFAAFLVFMFPVVFRFMQRRRPRSFDPRDPSADLVGDGNG